MAQADAQRKIAWSSDEVPPRDATASSIRQRPWVAPTSLLNVKMSTLTRIIHSIQSSSSSPLGDHSTVPFRTSTGMDALPEELLVIIRRQLWHNDIKAFLNLLRSDKTLHRIEKPVLSATTFPLETAGWISTFRTSQRMKSSLRSLTFTDIVLVTYYPSKELHPFCKALSEFARLCDAVWRCLRRPQPYSVGKAVSNLRYASIWLNGQTVSDYTDRDRDEERRISTTTMQCHAGWNMMVDGSDCSLGASSFSRSVQDLHKQGHCPLLHHFCIVGEAQPALLEYTKWITREIVSNSTLTIPRRRPQPFETYI